MNVQEMAQRAQIDICTATDGLDREVTGGYAGDLVSGVMANAKEGNVWVTWHAHPNIVAAALVAKLAAIILVCGRQPAEETARKAEQEGLPILISRLPAFEIVGKLHSMGITGAP